MEANIHVAKPHIGMTLAFKPSLMPALAGIPGQVVDIWPRFRSGDYLVTLEFAKPVKVGNEIVRHMDAFLSELYQPQEHEDTAVLSLSLAA